VPLPALEQKAREEIDRLLTHAGWLVQDCAQMHVTAGPGAQDRTETWSEETPEGRWRSYSCEDLLEPEVPAQEIIEDLQATLERFAAVAMKLGEE
jgi:hypothetical protein